MASDPRFVTNEARLGHRDALSEIITAWLLTRTTLEWTTLLEPHAVPCAPILDLPAVFAHPQVTERGMQINHASAHGSLPMIATPMRFDGVRPIADLPPPELDEHGDAIRAALGRSPEWPAA